ncbi:MAG: thiamine phosphate synthase [Candidatus Eisenbacteria bacterium]
MRRGLLESIHLYVISDRRRMGEDPAALARALLDLDGLMFQWREKDQSSARNEAALKPLEGVTAPLLINGDVTLASRLTIGVHLPEDGIATAEARSILGPSALIGRSTHGIDAARRAEEEGADFVTFGPIYDTESKRRYGPPQGIDRLRDLCRAIALPVFALGGIDASRVRECRTAGAHGVAAIGAIWDAPNPRIAASSLLAAWR